MGWREHFPAWPGAEIGAGGEGLTRSRAGCLPLALVSVLCSCCSHGKRHVEGLEAPYLPHLPGAVPGAAGTASASWALRRCCIPGPSGRPGCHLGATQQLQAVQHREAFKATPSKARRESLQQFLLTDIGLTRKKTWQLSPRQGRKWNRDQAEQNLQALQMLKEQPDIFLFRVSSDILLFFMDLPISQPGDLSENHANDIFPFFSLFCSFFFFLQSSW